VCFFSVSLADIYLLVAVQIGGRITEAGRQVINLIGLWILLLLNLEMRG